MPDKSKIDHENGHYIVYIDGEFFCTADTHLEAVQELERAEETSDNG